LENKFVPTRFDGEKILFTNYFVFGNVPLGAPYK